MKTKNNPKQALKQQREAEIRKGLEMPQMGGYEGVKAGAPPSEQNRDKKADHNDMADES